MTIRRSQKYSLLLLPTILGSALEQPCSALTLLKSIPPFGSILYHLGKLVELPFSGFFQFKGSFVNRQTNRKCCDRASIKNSSSNKFVCRTFKEVRTKLENASLAFISYSNEPTLSFAGIFIKFRNVLILTEIVIRRDHSRLHSRSSSVIIFSY